MAAAPAITSDVDTSHSLPPLKQFELLAEDTRTRSLSTARSSATAELECYLAET